GAWAPLPWLCVRPTAPPCPQHHAVPSSSSRQVKLLPASTCTGVRSPGSPGTCTGTKLSLPGLLPSWPELLAPQHHTSSPAPSLPVSTIAHAWFSQIERS